jgi:hypothetical protein
MTPHQRSRKPHGTIHPDLSTAIARLPPIPLDLPQLNHQKSSQQKLARASDNSQLIGADDYLLFYATVWLAISKSSD